MTGFYKGFVNSLRADSGILGFLGNGGNFNVGNIGAIGLVIVKRNL
jgi:hypothetical protein